MPRPDDGGPAFPRPVSEDRTQGDQPDGNSTIGEQDGMSIRDWFAGHALAAFIGQSKPADVEACGGVPAFFERTATAAYFAADAMLAARNRVDSDR